MAIAHPRCICYIDSNVLFWICKQLFLSWQDGFHMKGDDRQEKSEEVIAFWEYWWFWWPNSILCRGIKVKNVPLHIDYLVSNSDMITCYRGLWFRNSNYLAICWSFYIFYLYILCIFLFLACVEIITGVVSLVFFIYSIFWNVSFFS